MKLVCIQCQLEAMFSATAMETTFDETPEEHMRRVHPDPEVTHRRRQELEALLERCKQWDEQS